MYRLAAVPLVLVLAFVAGCRDESQPIIIMPTTPSPVVTTPPVVGSCGLPSCLTTPTPATPTPTTPITTPVPTTPARAPEISLFSADTARVTYTAGTFIRWEVLDPSASVRIDPYPGNVGPVGTVFVLPQTTTVYTLNARNAFGTTQRALIVVVLPWDTASAAE